jgi:hypothetical protein
MRSAPGLKTGAPSSEDVPVAAFMEDPGLCLHKDKKAGLWAFDLNY